MKNTRSIVLVSRKWSEAEIRITISNEEIGIARPLDDFLNVLATEMGNPTTMITTAQLRRRIEDAAGRIVTSMKSETARVL